MPPLHLPHHHHYHCSLSLLQGMVIHNMECNRDFTHLSSEIWATAAGDALASGDKLPSDHTSKTDVRGQCDNSSTGNVLRPPLQRVREGFNSSAPRIWRIYSTFIHNIIIFLKRKKKEKNVLLPVALSRLQFIWHAQVVLGAHGCNCKPH